MKINTILSEEILSFSDIPIRKACLDHQPVTISMLCDLFHIEQISPLLPPHPSKTRPVKFQSKNRREKAARATNNLLHSHLVFAHSHKIHPDITPQSRKITD